jgi:hypothetical protein
MTAQQNGVILAEGVLEGRGGVEVGAMADRTSPTPLIMKT